MRKEYESLVGYYNELGQLHREDGPAVEFVNGDKVWLINGRRHREDGPALEYANGIKYWILGDKSYGRKKPRNWEKLVLQYRAEKLLDI